MNDLLAILQNPNVAFLLLVIGGLGLATELVHPNLLTGILGASALVLASVGLAGLPLNWPGLILLVLGFGLLVLETQVASYGLLTLGGVILVGFGAALLYTTPPAGEVPVQVTPGVIVVATGALGVAMLGLAVVAARTRRMPAPAGQLGTAVPAGTEGIVAAPLSPLGTVQLAGETWSARTPDERIVPRGTPVRLAGFDGLTALVEPVDPTDPAGGMPPGVARTDPSAATAAADRP